MKRFSVIAAALALCVAATSANAATVTFKLYLGNFAQGLGTYKLTAVDSTGDNFGIASYSVELVGLTPTSILTYNHDSLRAASATNNTTSDEGSAGFTLLRSPDKSSGTGVAAVAIGGSQDTVVPTPNLIRGFGQTPGSLASNNLTGPAQEGDNWGNAGVIGPGSPAPLKSGEFEIARGTYTQGGNGMTGINFIPQTTASTFANIFTDNTGIATAAASINRVLVVPEPATLSLGALSLLGLVAAARRRA